MSAARLDIGRIDIVLSGIPQADAASTAHTLEVALRDRIGGWRLEIAGTVPLDLGDLDLGSVELARLDAPSLAVILLQRLAGGIENAEAESGSAV